MARSFVKMNGLGNDFVIVQDEAGQAPFRPTAASARAIADRAGGVGCDQLIALEPSAVADARLRIWNADGGEVGACGNAARCVAWLVMEAASRDEARLETAAGTLAARRAGPMAVEIDFGPPRLDWRDIPLAEPMDTHGIELQVGPIDAPALHTPGCVSMGNPHVVFFVDDAEGAPVAEVGPMIENHPLFPERTNVGFAQILSPTEIRLRVWERGAGLTRACGTGACAALVAAHRRGLAGREATLRLDGGDLLVRWRAEDDHVLMTGAVAIDYAGRLPSETGT
ncbi:MAG TPA: diaminopimelate epimerase [Caulobacteraceae bacterium]|nr:diaminopimelate epimerase [Caulobacteraceae bacterium]